MITLIISLARNPFIWILAAFGNPFAIALAAFREIGRIVKWILIEAV
jgi:hypothetical protein